MWLLCCQNPCQGWYVWCLLLSLKTIEDNTSRVMMCCIVVEPDGFGGENRLLWQGNQQIISLRVSRSLWFILCDWACWVFLPVVSATCWAIGVWGKFIFLNFGKNFDPMVKRREKSKRKKENNTQDSNVVPHRSTSWARACLTSLSRREAVLSSWYGRSQRKTNSQTI